MSEYDNRGRGAVWRSKSDHPQAPTVKGYVVAHRDIKAGEELDLAGWKVHSSNDNAPVLSLKMTDRFVKDDAPAPQQIERPAFDPDDIPF